jgi:hypothetical protein
MMPDVVYLGFLANCDETILSINIGNCFSIEELDHKKGFELLKTLDRSNNDMEIAQKYLTIGIMNDSYKPFYLIRKKINPGIEVENSHDLYKLSEFHNCSFKLINEGTTYIRDKLRIMRLFKEGNIISPLALTYVDLESPSLLTSSQSLMLNLQEKYHLNGGEAEELPNFLKKVKLPFSDKSINLAFTSFEASYDTHNSAFSMMSCMIALECLLGDSGAGKSYNLARNAAVLIGKDMVSSEEIYREVRSLYKKRNHLVHEGESKFTNEDIKKARNLVRASIINYLQAGLSKSELLSKLNSIGYSEKRQWQIST